MSTNIDPNDPAQEHAPQGGSGYASGPGFAAGPPPSPRGHYKRWLIAAAAVAVTAGATAGGLTGTMGSTAAGTATATSKTALSASQIASRVDPGLVDVVSADGDQDATSAGTGIVLSSTGEVLTNNHFQGQPSQSGQSTEQARAAPAA